MLFWPKVVAAIKKGRCDPHSLTHKAKKGLWGEVPVPHITKKWAFLYRNKKSPHTNPRHPIQKRPALCRKHFFFCGRTPTVFWVSMVFLISQTLIFFSSKRPLPHKTIENFFTTSFWIQKKLLPKNETRAFGDLLFLQLIFFHQGFLATFVDTYVTNPENFL